MYAQRDAILRLLKDDDLHTVEGVKGQLLAGGTAALPDLEDLLNSDQPVVRWRVRQVMGQIRMGEARSRFSGLCREFPKGASPEALEEAALMLASSLVPSLDIAETKEELDRWGRELAMRIADARTPGDRLLAMGSYLGRDQAIHGDGEEAYALTNALLPKVVETRMGMPVTLGLLYILVGHRAGIHLEGVNFPGHFLVRHGALMVDPYERGRVLTTSDCLGILARQNLPMDPGFFEVASPRAILRRMMLALRHYYQKEDPTVAKLLEGWLVDLGQPSVV